jgi:hypothetical protein
MAPFLSLRFFTMTRRTTQVKMALEYTMGNALFLIFAFLPASLSSRLAFPLYSFSDSTHPRERPYDRVTPSWVQKHLRTNTVFEEIFVVTWGHLPRLLPDILLLLFSFQSVIRMGLACARRPIPPVRGQLRF